MLKPKHYIPTQIINIERDRYTTKSDDPYYKVQRRRTLFYWVMVIAVGLFVFWLSVKLGD